LPTGCQLESGTGITTGFSLRFCGESGGGVRLDSAAGNDSESSKAIMASTKRCGVIV
jgi:hypothetical protein